MNIPSTSQLHYQTQFFHSEQSLRNAKVVVASASTSAAVDSDFEENDFTRTMSLKKVKKKLTGLTMPTFPVEHLLDEYKSQARRAMKEPIVEAPNHKKLSSSYQDNLKLQKMQFMSLHTNLKSVQEEIENTKEK